MLRVLVRFLVALAVLGLAGTGPVAATTSRVVDARYHPNVLLVSLRSGYDRDTHRGRLTRRDLGTQSTTALAERFDVRSVRRVFRGSFADDPIAWRYGLPGTVVLKARPGTDMLAMRNAFRRDPGVVFAEFDRRIRASYLPNDPYFGQQWGLEKDLNTRPKKNVDIDALSAWAITRGDPSALIAIIDSGILEGHPDLSGRVRTDIGYDFINDDDDPTDDYGHGTAVASIAAAATDNNQGMAGACPGCSLLAVKVLDEDGEGSSEGAAAGIQYAAEVGARIINMSLGVDPSCGCSATIAQAINYAFDKGSLLIGAAGNGDGTSAYDSLAYPASSPRVVAVGASGRNGKAAAWSNFGADLDLIAPGVDIEAATFEGWDTVSGTSASTPFVAAIAGLVWSASPGLINTQVWRTLQLGTRDLRPAGRDDLTGYGLANARYALERVTTATVDAPVDECDGEPSNGCGDCATEVALSDEPGAAIDLRLMRQLRDDVLAGSALGRQLTDVFYRHTFEAAGILFSDDGMRARAQRLGDAVMPLVSDLVDPPASPTTLTAQQVSAAHAFLDALAEHGSPQLGRDVRRLWNRLDLEAHVGQDIVQVWSELSEVAP